MCLKKAGISKVRMTYIARLIGRCLILLLCFGFYFFKPEMFLILDSDMFFKEMSVFHILWIIWMVDMLCQIVPVGKYVSIGSEKMFLKRFKPAEKETDAGDLKKYIISSTVAAYKVFIVWAV